MCNQCYHKHGRTKKPWRCNHEKLYAHGLCQNCYINAYNKKRSQKQKDEKIESFSNSPSSESNLSSNNTKELPTTTDDKDIISNQETPKEQQESA